MSPEPEQASEQASADTGSPRRKTGRVALTVLAAVALLAAGAWGGQVLLGPGDGGGSDPDGDQVVDADAELVTVRDPEAGFAISYPQDWTRLETTEPQIRLLVAIDGEDSFLVRTVPFGDDVDPDSDEALATVVDELIGTDENISVIAGPLEVEVGGSPGRYYLYQFTDPASGQQGVHAHYFALHRGRLVSLVFQALPAERFTALADVFDAVANSFELIEG